MDPAPIFTVVPVGTVVFYAGDLSNSANLAALKDQGWLVCDGASYAETDYPDLFAAIGTANGGGAGSFNVPDLRDRFIRGVDAEGSPIDPDADTRGEAQPGGATGRNVGSLQEGATSLPKTPAEVSDSATHTHTFQHLSSDMHEAWSGTTYTMARWSAPATTDEGGAHSHTLSGYDSSTAPINIALFVIIKAADVTSAASEVMPTGAIAALAGPTDAPPPGWLGCDGRAYVETTYTNLSGVIYNNYGGDGTTVFNVPDLRGYFVRGTSHATGRDPDAASRYPLNTGGNSGDATGSAQDWATYLSPTKVVVDEGGAHTHNKTLVPLYDHHAAWGASGPAAFNCMEWTESPTITSADGVHTHSLLGGDAETRPLNVYMDWFIATDDIPGNAPPIGSIVAFGGDVTNLQTMGLLIMLGWYPCNGASVPINDPDNAALYAVIGTTYGGSALMFNVPDLRGYFVVGAGATRTVGSFQLKSTTGAPVTAITTPTDGVHTHTVPNIPTESHRIDVVAGVDLAENNPNASPSSSDGLHGHTLTTPGDNESRPVNVNVDFAIRYK